MMEAAVQALLACTGLVVAAWLLLLLPATTLHHANLRLPSGVERASSSVIVTPSIDGVRHHRVRCDTDSNDASVSSLRDRLLGSRRSTLRQPGTEFSVEGKRARGDS